jgi:hypothetical protein
MLPLASGEFCDIQYVQTNGRTSDFNNSFARMRRRLKVEVCRQERDFIRVHRMCETETIVEDEE